MKQKQETMIINKQALIEAAMEWEQRQAIQYQVLEHQFQQLENLLQSCRETLCTYGVTQSKNALLALFLSNNEWDTQMRRALTGQDAAHSEP